jgi:hypothetical protein
MLAFFDSFAGWQLTLRCNKEVPVFQLQRQTDNVKTLSVCDSVVQLAFRHVPLPRTKHLCLPAGTGNVNDISFELFCCNFRNSS